METRKAVQMSVDRRRDRLIKQKRHDAYEEKLKLPDPTLCTECGVLYTDGRWVWTGTEDAVNETVCPACRRIAERNPAGFVTVRGEFYKARMDEVENLVHNAEKAETLQHPMERLVEVTREAEGLLVTTTGVHLARRVGDALSRAYGGDYSIEYLDDEKRVRISLTR
jgi:NMD protein affecting ribosome stability and mRNA decay